MNDTNITRVEEQILQTVKNNQGINNTQLSNTIDVSPGLITKKTSALQDKGLLIDKAWKGNQTSYHLADDIRVDKNFRLETIFNYHALSHVVSIGFFISGFALVPVDYLYLYIAGFLIAFVPHLIVSANYVLEEGDLHEIQISQTQTGKEDEPDSE